jgi:hypothetical protein
MSKRSSNNGIVDVNVEAMSDSAVHVDDDRINHSRDRYCGLTDLLSFVEPR